MSGDGTFSSWNPLVCEDTLDTRERVRLYVCLGYSKCQLECGMCCDFTRVGELICVFLFRINSYLTFSLVSSKHPCFEIEGIFVLSILALTTLTMGLLFMESCNYGAFICVTFVGCERANVETA